MVKEGNHRILKLSLAMKRRAWFLGLWTKLPLLSAHTTRNSNPYCVIWVLYLLAREPALVVSLSKRLELLTRFGGHTVL